MKPWYSTLDPITAPPCRVSLVDKPASARLVLREAREPGPEPCVGSTLSCAVCGYHQCACPGVKLGGVCLCGADSWVGLPTSPGYKCTKCARIVGYAAWVNRMAEAANVPSPLPWPPVSAGLVSAPTEERWRGSVLGLGTYDLAGIDPAFSLYQLYFQAESLFAPKRFRITANGPGVRVNVVIQNCFQFRCVGGPRPGPEGGLPQEAFAEDRVNDKFDLLRPGMVVEVFLYNGSTERRHGSAWFEGEEA